MPKYLNILFDAVLLGIMGVSGWGIWGALSHGLWWGLLGAPLILLVLYCAFVEPYWLVTRVYPVKLRAQSAGGYTFVFISDLHAGPYKSARYFRRLVRRILAVRPDFVIIGGDFVYDRCSEVEKLAPLAELALSLPVYAVLGDHDYESPDKHHPTALESAAYIEARLTSWGVQVLRNKSVVWGRKVRIVGLDEIRTGRALPGELLREGARNNDNLDTVLVVHSPDCVLNPLTHRAHLILCGHTHAGQMRLPWIGPLAFVPTILGKAWDHGFFRINPDCRLFISSGVGESGPRTRLGVRPEIVVFKTAL